MFLLFGYLDTSNYISRTQLNSSWTIGLLQTQKFIKDKTISQMINQWITENVNCPPVGWPQFQLKWDESPAFVAHLLVGLEQYLRV